MKLYISLLVLSVALLVSAACGGEPAPSPAPALTVPPSPTATDVSTPPLTATPAATPVLPTTVAPTPSATPTLTPTPAATVKQTATPAEAESDAIDYRPYLGKFVANFGPFKDAEFTVLVQKNHLAIDVPGQTVYELKDPDEEGMWYLAASDAIAVSFERDDSGDVTTLKQHRSGRTFKLPRVGVEVPVEIPLDELHKYLGS